MLSAMWKPLTTAFENIFTDKKTTAPLQTKAQGILKNLRLHQFLCLVCWYLDVLELVTPAPKMFEEEDLMPCEIKPIINKTILNLNNAIQCDTDEDTLTCNLALFAVLDGSVITTECFNATNAHNYVLEYWR